MALNDVLVLPDFYPDPDAVRARGLEATYDDDGWSIEHYFPPHVKERLEDTCKMRLTPRSPGTGHGDFLLATRHRGAKPIHADGRGYLSVLVPLTPDDLVPGDPADFGTSFWQHISTGFTRTPTSRELGRLRMSRDEFKRIMIRAMQAETVPLGWNLIGRTQYEYNTAIIWPGHLFHSTTGGFGENIYDGRLGHSYLFPIKGQSH